MSKLRVTFSVSGLGGGRGTGRVRVATKREGAIAENPTPVCPNNLMYKWGEKGGRGLIEIGVRGANTPHNR